MSSTCAAARRDIGAYEFQPGVLDCIPPNTTIGSGPSGPTSDPAPTFTFTSEPGATFQCRVDGGAFAGCASPRTTAALADGPHTFRVRAIDAVGNIDPTPAARSFTVDTTAPETTITKGPKRKTKKKQASFEFGAGEEGAEFECALDGEAFSPCASPHTERVKKGKHELLVRAVDAVGNVESTPAEHDWKRKKKRR